MDKTQNYSLQKPLSVEKYSISVHNMNMDLIDSALKRIEQKNESQDNLLATKEALNDEIVRASEKENEIIQDLDSESTRAQNAENDLSNNISNEIDRAIIAENAIQENLSEHIANFNNVDNTSDMDKPVSTAQQNAIDSVVSTHNTSSASHDDIRTLISGLTTRLNALADSDDTTLDQLSEIVAYIKNNKSLIDSITTSKVSISDIVDNLDSTDPNKVLSSKQGNVIKGLITDLISLIENKVDKVSGKGLSTNDYTTTEKNKLGGIAPGAEVNVQPDWDITDTANDAYIKNKPTSLPASDVHAWAKADTKPSYTKSEIGLGNVENKSSATIRSELTKENVTTALGYTPPITNTTYSPSSTIPKANGTASAGTESAYARGDHIHPLQTSVSGNAGTATRLQKWKTSSPATTLSRRCKIATITLTGNWNEAHFMIATSEHEVNGGSAIFMWNVAVGNSHNIEKNTIEYLSICGNLVSNKNTFYTEAITSSTGVTFNLWCQPLANYNTFDFTILNESSNITHTLSFYNNPEYQNTSIELTGSISYGTIATQQNNTGGITYSDSEPTNLIDGMTWIGN